MKKEILVGLILIVALAAYWLFGGWQAKPEAGLAEEVLSAETKSPFTTQQTLTVIIILSWIIGVLVFKLNLGLSTFAAVVLLVGLRAADESAALRKVPWGVIMMVCGVSLLIAILEKTGGMELFTTLLAKIASQSTINGVIAFITGIISTYSSTSGVVLPAFLPTAPKLAQQIGGDSLAIALSINVGSALVDVSPLSTLGALCIATVSDPTASKKLFWQLMVWGLTMTVVGALFCQLLAGLIARA